MASFDFAALTLRYAQDERRKAYVRPEPFDELRTNGTAFQTVRPEPFDEAQDRLSES